MTRDIESAELIYKWTLINSEHVNQVEYVDSYVLFFKPVHVNQLAYFISSDIDESDRATGENFDNTVRARPIGFEFASRVCRWTSYLFQNKISNFYISRANPFINVACETLLIDLYVM